VAPTCESRYAVFRQIAQQSYIDWPTYDSTPLFDRFSLPALESDVRVVADVWFNQDEHQAVEPFVSTFPLAYVHFDAHDRYAGSTTYEMETLFRLFLLKELHGWDHETVLVEYLTQHPDLCEQIGLESVPNQSTLWRSWHHRFTADLQDTLETAARTILIKAQNTGVAVPREPERQSRRHSDENTESNPDDQTVLKQAETVTEHISRVTFPAFSLDRGEGCEIHENAYWGLQTYLGLRERLAANEGARSFTYESTRERTPLGHSHREHIRDLPIAEIREMYRQAVNRLLSEVAETEEFFRAGIVAIDNVLMDREFDSQHVLEMISQRGLSYVVPKRMQTSEKAQAKRLLQRDQDRYETDRKLHLGKNEWHETTLIYRRKKDSEHNEHRQYSVFMTNCGSGHLTEYGYRWEIESGYRSIKRFMAATTSKDFGLRFFYFAFACLLYSIWRAVDLLVQAELTGEYEHSPVITADNTLTLLKKETGIG